MNLISCISNRDKWTRSFGRGRLGMRTFGRGRLDLSTFGRLKIKNYN